jgi:HD-GYP domain-containing protein (c-di-GMP phosphodiesterase class II)
VLVFVGLAPLATVAWKLIDVNREALTTSRQEYQLLLASSIANQLDLEVEGLRAQVQQVARTLGAAIRADGTVSRGEVRRALEGMVEEPLLYLRYSYTDHRGGHAIAVGELPEPSQATFAGSVREAVQQLARPTGRAEGAILSDPFVAESGPRNATLVVSAPVLSGQRFHGVLSSMVNLTELWNRIAARNRTGHVIYALDTNGLVLASTDPVRIRPGEDASHSALVYRFLSGEGRALETMPFAELEGGTEQHYLGSYAATRQSWGVFVRGQLSQVYLPVRTMIESTLTWALAAVGLAALAAMFFARSLSNPINRLADASRAFARGDFSTRVEFRSKNEIGELANTFNLMAGRIEDHILRLRRAAEENNQLFLGTIRALAEAIDAKDPYTRGHSMRVNRYSVMLAHELGLSSEEIQDIHVSSLLHDVGKIGIDDHVLKKPGKLTPEEFEIIKKHPVLGANIMAPIPQMQKILPGLRWHHERWAGGGYPDGLQGEEIPLMARIIAVADTFDAISTHRPYQTAMTFPEALQLVNKLKGVNLDERVVEAFNRVYAAGRIRPEPEDAALHAQQHQEPVVV